MATETSRTRPGRISTERLRESVVRLIEHLDHECDFFPEGEIPEGHIAHHIERLVAWCNQPEERPAPEGYQGWRTYETWLANLWLTNDNGTDTHCREQARDAVGQFPAEGRRLAPYEGDEGRVPAGRPGLLLVLRRPARRRPGGRVLV